MLTRVRATAAFVAAAAYLASSALAAGPKASDFARSKAWQQTNLKPVRGKAVKAARISTDLKPGLFVVTCYGGIIRDKRPDGRAIKLGDTEFRRGIIAHAPSQIIVRLPSAGKSFSAVAGMDANSGGGSVVLSVDVGGKNAFKSAVMRAPQPGVPVKVDLAGAREFTIAASDAGDGISSDHAAWADAKVTLANGKELWISEMKASEAQLMDRLSATPPFSFVYNGKPSDSLLPTWKFKESSKKLTENRRQRTQTYTDPKTGLQVRLVATSYADFPTVDYIVYLKNTGKADTPIIENIQGLDSVFQGKQFKLHHFHGSTTSPQDYEPYVQELAAGSTTKLSASGGVPTAERMSYFNIETAANEGIILALGWSGQWASSFVRDSKNGLRVVAGQELTHLKLHPGEEIRTPQIVMLFWKGGDWIDGQNVWRRWMMAHNMPRPGGKLIQPMFGGCHGNLLPTAAEDIAEIKGYLADGIKMEHWIIDAGWYPNKGSWPNTGTWEPDPIRFPNGLKEVADVVHANGMDFIVWFEPERSVPDTWLQKNHPEWILSGYLTNLGNPEAREWATNMVDGMMKSQGIDHFRTDYNLSPLDAWRANDAPDRQGMTENLYVQGFRLYFDEILRRDPKRFIDSCAGGGRRNDVETLKRAVPLLRSDYWGANEDWAIGTQGLSYGIALWYPWSGTGAAATSMYLLRSSYGPCYRMEYQTTNPNRRKDLMLQAIREFDLLRPYWYGDYYPMTPHSLAKDQWIGWQYNSLEKGGGFVQAFRRDDCMSDSITFKLRGLDPKATYKLTNLDVGRPTTLTGQAMMDGLKIEIADRPGSALLIYEKVN